jgi:histone H3/H4
VNSKVNIALKRKRDCGEVDMTESEISVASMHRLCKRTGAERVSEAAAIELARVLEDIEIATRKVTGK